MTLKHIIIACLTILVTNQWLFAQTDISKKESEYYKITTVPIPDDIVLEVGGLAFLPDDRLAVATRRGEIWLIENPYVKNGIQPKYTKFAYGLHEPLGLAYHNNALYTTQRAELTKIIDSNHDDVGDKFQTIYSWPLSGNYHEYSYGPLFLPNGDMLITLNLAWIGHGASLAKWRGWLLKVTEEGEMTPIATGLRSPAGFNFDKDGALFYAENQGDWIGSGRITHLEKGDFAGNPEGLIWTSEPLSPLRLKPEMIPDSVGLMHEFAKSVSSLKVPAVWFPHTIMGISTSAILTDTTKGKFGPFEGQMLVGDQGHSKIMRVALEKVNGEYQGACFPFREGFSSGILRFAWGSDGSLFVGMTSRGWASTGKEKYGLQKVSWNGKTPFEIKTIKAMSNGFELEFTEAVQKSVAEDISSYSITSFIYSYHSSYGSPIIQQQACEIVGASLMEDGKKVKLYVDGLRAGYIHEIKANGILSNQSKSLLHPVGYYTLNNIPEGEHAMPMLAQSTTSSSKDDDSNICGWDASKRITEMPSDWTNGPDIVINIGTEPGLKFSVTDFEVPSGAKVQLTFNNNDDMLHNLVVTKPENIEQVSDASMQMGLEGPQRGYIPDSDNILFHTCILQPESSESIYFVAPEVDEYKYLCTFPGHSKVMRGVMKVIPSKTALR